MLLVRCPARSLVPVAASATADATAASRRARRVRRFRPHVHRVIVAVHRTLDH